MIPRPSPETRTRPVIFLSVGEPSGDLHGARLAGAIRRRLPDARLIGLGGPRMEAEGVELLARVEDLAVMGFVEVLSRLPFFLRLRRRVFAALESEGVDLVIPIDYPGFNLRLARHAHREGRRVLYYIAPQVWAWHRSRAADLARDADAIAVILPFEADLLRVSGGRAEFVGHPLLDRSDAVPERSVWARSEGLDPERPLLALMPGSRTQELERHLPVFFEAAAAVRAARPEVQVVVGAASGVEDSAYSGSPFPVTRDARGLIHHASAVLAKSGTTTLEVALAGTPFVVAYRVNALTYRIARRVVRVPHIALANLVVGREVVPEFIQDQATAPALAGALLPLLDDESADRREMLEGLAAVRAALGTPGAADRVAAMAAGLLGR